MKHKRVIKIPFSTVEFDLINGQQFISSGIILPKMKKRAVFFGIAEKKKTLPNDNIQLNASYVLPQIFVSLLSTPDRAISLVTSPEEQKLLFTGNLDGIFYKLFRIGGILLKTGFLSHEEPTIDINALPIGIYLLIVIRGGRETCAYKIKIK